MVQEVQQQWNWYQTPNRIEGIWVSERKVNDYTQVRNKTSNMVVFKSNNINIRKDRGEVFASSWTITSSNWDVYKTVGWSIYMPLPWAYRVEYSPDLTYPQKTYLYTFKLYLDNKIIYENQQYPWDFTYWKFQINVWRKNRLRASLQTQDTAGSSFPITLTLIKL